MIKLYTSAFSEGFQWVIIDNRELICCSKSRLFFDFLFSIRIYSRKKVIFEKPLKIKFSIFCSRMSTWLFGGGGGAHEAEDGAAIIRKLASRIESSTLLDDRRDSLRAIKVFFFSFFFKKGSGSFCRIF